MSATSNYNSEEVTFVPGFVRGFRAWNLSPEVVGLRSVTRNWHWLPGENKATCEFRSCECEVCREAPSHVAPFPTCSCGIYGRYADYRHGYTGVQGIIKATGNIIIGTSGFRAEKVQVEALVANPFSKKCIFEALLPPHARDWASGSTTIPRPSWAPAMQWSMAPVDEVLGMLSEMYQVPIFRAFDEAREALPFPDLSGLVKQKEETCREATTPTIP